MLNRVILCLLLLQSPISFAATSILTATLGKNGYLKVNERLESPNGKVGLVMQADGNLVMFKNPCLDKAICPIWDSKSVLGQGQFFMAMQEDGNLVIYRGTPEKIIGPIWSSLSPGVKSNYFLALQDDSNLVIYRGTGLRDNQGAVWSSKSGTVVRQAPPESNPKDCKWIPDRKGVMHLECAQAVQSESKRPYR